MVPSITNKAGMAIPIAAGAVAGAHHGTVRVLVVQGIRDTGMTQGVLITLVNPTDGPHLHVRRATNVGAMRGEMAVATISGAPMRGMAVELNMTVTRRTLR